MTQIIQTAALQSGAIYQIPLVDNRFGGVMVVQPEPLQVALLAVIWDCAPSEGDLLRALPHAQFRVRPKHLAAAHFTGVRGTPPAVDAACAQVDAPLRTLIDALITTAM